MFPPTVITSKSQPLCCPSSLPVLGLSVQRVWPADILLGLINQRGKCFRVEQMLEVDVVSMQRYHHTLPHRVFTCGHVLHICGLFVTAAHHRTANSAAQNWGTFFPCGASDILLSSHFTASLQLLKYDSRKLVKKEVFQLQHLINKEAGNFLFQIQRHETFLENQTGIFAVLMGTWSKDCASWLRVHTKFWILVTAYLIWVSTMKSHEEYSIDPHFFL